LESIGGGFVTSGKSGDHRVSLWGGFQLGKVATRIPARCSGGEDSQQTPFLQPDGEKGVSGKLRKGEFAKVTHLWIPEGTQIRKKTVWPACSNVKTCGNQK